MRWRRGKAPDVIDRRGAARGGGGMGLPIPGGIGGAGGGIGLLVVIVIVALNLLGGGGGFDIPSGGGIGGGPVPGADRAAPIPPGQDPERELKDFSAFVFTDAQTMWSTAFRKAGDPYRDAKLVLYRSGVDTGCGSATSAVGPFYCPADQRVYLDLSFYDQMRRELRAPGDFAWAYVIAHEVGHHIQRQIGTSEEVTAQQRSNPDQANELSVRLELQADCYAGVWATTVYKKGLLETGDLDEAFKASQAVGDDRLQRQATGRIDPDSFTHGTSAQRRKWFENGYDGGDPAACDTFSVDDV